MDIHLRKNVNLDTELIFFTRINSKQIIDRNVKHKCLKFIEDDIGERLDILGYHSDFLYITPQGQGMKEIIDKIHFINIKNDCPAKDNVKMIRREATDWEKIFAKDMHSKELLSKIHNKLLKLNKKNYTSIFKK